MAETATMTKTRYQGGRTDAAKSAGGGRPGACPVLVKKSHISRNEMVHGTRMYYERGVRIGGNVRRGGIPPRHEAIVDFKNASKRLLNWTYTQGPWVSMITLTYHDWFPLDFRESKRQLNRFLQYMRDHVPSHFLRYGSS